MNCYLIVKSDTSLIDKKEFENWYANEHLSEAKKTLMAGFTTVRELGGVISTSLRDAINSGYVSGPRIYSAGKSIATTGGHADPSSGLNMSFAGDPGPKEGVINGPSDARKAVRQRYKNGADLIKITATGGVLSVAKNSKNPQFTEEEIRAIVETADQAYQTFLNSDLDILVIGYHALIRKNI